MAWSKRTSLGCLLAVGVLKVVSAEAAQPPNVVLIFTDDHGWADVGVQGILSDIRTPNTDRLANQGVRFTDGYVTAPQCVPSRSGLMSGRYQTRFGVESNTQFVTPHGMDGFDEQQTIAERLKKAGYVTGMAGKWHLGPGNQQIMTHGFDYMYSRASDRPARANVDLQCQDVPFGEYPSDVYHIDACTDVAVGFIQRFKDKPFFFYLAYRAPHVPLDAPQKYLDRFPGDMPHRRQQALAMISAVDDGVGRVLDTLEECGLAENTIVFYIGDNGAPLKIYKNDEPGGGPGWDGSLNDPLNGEKGMVSEGGIRTPFLAQWKGTFPAGLVYSEPVISLDVAATACAEAGLPADPILDGVNLTPYLTGQATGSPHDALFWRWEGQFAIRQGDWKYVLVNNHGQYLFNLRSDKEELHNVIAEQPERAAELKTRLTDWVAELSPPGFDLDSWPIMKAFFTHYYDGKPDEAKKMLQEQAAKH